MSTSSMSYLQVNNRQGLVTIELACQDAERLIALHCPDPGRTVSSRTGKVLAVRAGGHIPNRIVVAPAMVNIGQICTLLSDRLPAAVFSQQWH